MISSALLRQLGEGKLESAQSLADALVAIEVEHGTVCAWEEATASQMKAALDRANVAYREYGDLSAARKDLVRSRDRLAAMRDDARKRLLDHLNDLLPEGERREFHTQEALFA